MEKPGLIVFQKNLEKGKVKTRLARTVGDDKALNVFKALIKSTYDQIPTNMLDVHVFFGKRIEPLDHPLHESAIFHVQEGKDLGEKMTHAFEKLLNQGYKKLMIIGTDCPFITRKIFDKALQHLESHDVVIGPANDGGYYLLGAKSSPQKIMQGIEWSTSTVLESTLKAIDRQGKTYQLLEVLTDIDNEEDFQKYKQIFENGQ